MILILSIISFTHLHVHTDCTPHTESAGFLPPGLVTWAAHSQDADPSVLPRNTPVIKTKYMKTLGELIIFFGIDER